MLWHKPLDLSWCASWRPSSFCPRSGRGVPPQASAAWCPPRRRWAPDTATGTAPSAIHQWCPGSLATAPPSPSNSQSGFFNFINKKLRQFSYKVVFLAYYLNNDVIKVWPHLTLISASKGLMKGEPLMVCVLTIWSSSVVWMSSTEDRMLMPESL